MRSLNYHNRVSNYPSEQLLSDDSYYYWRLYCCSFRAKVSIHLIFSNFVTRAWQKERSLTHLSSLWNKPTSLKGDAIFCTFHKRSTCKYVCTCAVAHGHSCTFMSGSRTPEAFQLSAPNLPWSCTGPSWILLCSAWAAYRSCREERTFGWVAVDETGSHRSWSGPWRQQAKQPWTFISGDVMYGKPRIGLSVLWLSVATP